MYLEIELDWLYIDVDGSYRQHFKEGQSYAYNTYKAYKVPKYYTPRGFEMNTHIYTILVTDEGSDIDCYINCPYMGQGYGQEDL